MSTDSNKLQSTKFLESAYLTDTVPGDYQKRVEILIDVIQDTSKLIQICLHLSSRTYTGYWSLSFNKWARNCDLNLLPEVLNFSSKDFWPELQALNETELKETLQIRDREYKALYSAFQMTDEPVFRSVIETHLPDTECSDLFSRCVNQLSITETLANTGSLKDASRDTFSSPNIVEIVVDKPVDNKYTIPWTYCLTVKELLFNIDKVNPLNQLKFSPNVISNTKTKFCKEYKFVQNFLNMKKHVFGRDL